METNTIKNHFESEAKEFDEVIKNLIPYYNQMVEALVLSIPFDKNMEINVIDLGCGTGTISKAVKTSFPNAKITCVDLAENMILMAKDKLRDFQGIKYLQGDFNNFIFPEKYNVVISSLALHHLISDEDKKDFYKKIYENLTDNGFFCNADVVLGSNDFNTELYMEKWKEYMIKNVGKDETENKWVPKYYEEDKPIDLMKHFSFMEEIGFKEFDIYWKYYNFSVYGGKK